MKCTIFALVTIAGCAAQRYNQYNPQAAMEAAFRTYDLVPREIAVTPQSPLGVVYADGTALQFGNLVWPRQVQQPPTAIDWPSTPNTLYTLFLLDFNELGGNETTDHWTIVNIPGTRQLSAGNVVTDYFPSAPRAKPLPNRYVFLVYAQQAPINIGQLRMISNTNVTARFPFSLPGFVIRNGLIGPVAGNFYTSYCDETVIVSWRRAGVADTFGGSSGC